MGNSNLVSDKIIWIYLLIVVFPSLSEYCSKSRHLFFECVQSRFWSKGERYDTLLKGWITSTLTKEVLDHVVRIGTSAEVWSTLKDSFARSSNEREHIFQSKLQSLKRDACSSLSNFLGNFKNYCDELVATGRPIEDSRKVFWGLTGSSRTNWKTA